MVTAEREPPVVVVGGGISGIAAATELSRAGVATTVVDRGRRLGGRMAVRTLRDTGTRWDGRPVDLGASYFTARDPEFVAQVDDWESRGMARPWTDTLQTAGPDGLIGSRRGPMRWSSPTGLRSLVEDSAAALSNVIIDNPREVTAVGLTSTSPSVDGLAAAAVLLCGPDPQMARLIESDEKLSALHSELGSIAWEPVLAVVAVFDERCWPDITGVFVNASPVLSFIADDGSRRGDHAAVLVLHSSAEYAAAHLENPGAGAPAMLEGAQRVLGLSASPVSTSVHRWSVARPEVARAQAHHFDADLSVGLAGDSWSSGPRIEAAWLSGRSLGRAAASHLAR